MFSSPPPSVFFPTEIAPRVETLNNELFLSRFCILINWVFNLCPRDANKFYKHNTGRPHNIGIFCTLCSKQIQSHFPCPSGPQWTPVSGPSWQQSTATFQMHCQLSTLTLCWSYLTVLKWCLCQITPKCIKPQGFFKIKLTWIHTLLCSRIYSRTIKQMNKHIMFDRQCCL